MVEGFVHSSLDVLIKVEVVAALRRQALTVCRLFQVRDYGRVDIRLDRNMDIHVLEVNANPCLSPDAGFCAAALHHGIGFTELVGRLLACTEARP